MLEMYFSGGISLSPAFVVMFAMQHYNLSWEDALHMVQNRRYCISPNGGFLTQIKVRNFGRISVGGFSLKCDGVNRRSMNQSTKPRTPLLPTL